MGRVAPPVLFGLLGWGCPLVEYCGGGSFLSPLVLVVESLAVWSTCGAAWWWPVLLFFGCCGAISCVVRVGCLQASPDGDLGGGFLGGGLSVGVAAVW